MNQFDRRQFLEISAAALMAAANSGTKAEESASVKVARENGKLRIAGTNYAWEWNQAKDQFRLLDSKGLLIAASRFQPAVVVSAPGDMRTIMQHRENLLRMRFVMEPRPSTTKSSTGMHGSV